MTKEFKCNSCKYNDTYSLFCETCFENEHFEENKYRWHDLRKNPKDLPKVDKDETIEVWVCILPHNAVEPRYDKDWYGWFDSVQDWDWYGCGSEIIGWKYIEPFEVEE